jgi:hypothetical protein
MTYYDNRIVMAICVLVSCLAPKFSQKVTFRMIQPIVGTYFPQARKS